MSYDPTTYCIAIEVEDPETGEPMRTTIALPLYEAQADAIDAVRTMAASAIGVFEGGFTADLIDGRLRYLPAGWSAWWADAGINPCNGIRALAAVGAFEMWCAGRKRSRGERGKSKDGARRRGALLAAVLRRIAAGMSWRGAVEATLHDCEPFSTEKDAAALLQYVKRHLRKSRKLR